MAEGHQKFVGEELPMAAAHSGNNARGLWLWLMGLWGLSRSAMMTIFALTPRERIPMSLMMLAAPAASVQRCAEAANAWFLGGVAGPLSLLGAWPAESS